MRHLNHRPARCCCMHPLWHSQRGRQSLPHSLPLMWTQGSGRKRQAGQQPRPGGTTPGRPLVPACTTHARYQRESTAGLRNGLSGQRHVKSNTGAMPYVTQGPAKFPRSHQNAALACGWHGRARSGQPAASCQLPARSTRAPSHCIRHSCGCSRSRGPRPRRFPELDVCVCSSRASGNGPRRCLHARPLAGFSPACSQSPQQATTTYSKAGLAAAPCHFPSKARHLAQYSSAYRKGFGAPSRGNSQDASPAIALQGGPLHAATAQCQTRRPGRHVPQRPSQQPHKRLVPTGCRAGRLRVR